MMLEKALNRNYKKLEPIWYPNQIIIQQSFSQKNLMAIEKKKPQIFLNKSDYKDLSVL